MDRKITEQALALATDVGIGDSAQHMYGQLQAIQGLLYFELAADDIRLEQLPQPEQPAPRIAGCTLCGFCAATGEPIQPAGYTAICVACDGRPAIENNPCAVCAAIAQPTALMEFPDSFISGLPEGTTHITKILAYTRSAGRIEASLNAFKYDETGFLRVWQTDGDNEYGNWALASLTFTNVPKVWALYPSKPIFKSEVTNTEVMEKAFYALRDAHKYLARNEHTGQLEDECWLVLVALQTALSKEANNSNA